MEFLHDHITEEQARQSKADTLEEVKSAQWAFERTASAGIALTATIIELSSGVVQVL